LKFVVDTRKKYGSKILSETLLAAAVGAIASGLVLLLALPKQRSPAPTESYEVTWTFHDSPAPGMLKMQYTQVSQRRGKKDEPFWSKTFFEPYLWTTGVVNYSVRCAANRAAFNLNSPVGQPIELPVVSRGFYLELDKAGPAYLPAVCRNDGDKMWVQIQASVDVPETYWDIAAGLVKLGSPPKFKMEDRTKKQNLAFVMAGPNDQFTHNIGPKDDFTAHELQFDETVAGDNSVRCQVYWYPIGTLVTNVYPLITNRFRYMQK
jgi:uncharacterized membrane protein